MFVLTNQVSLRGASSEEMSRDALLAKVSQARELRSYARRANAAAIFIQVLSLFLLHLVGIFWMLFCGLINFITVLESLEVVHCEKESSFCDPGRVGEFAELPF